MNHEIYDLKDILTLKIQGCIVCYDSNINFYILPLTTPIYELDWIVRLNFFQKTKGVTVADKARSSHYRSEQPNLATLD